MNGAKRNGESEIQIREGRKGKGREGKGREKKGGEGTEDERI